ncbi:MAG: hypothetical protein R2744_04015 [Bacteroidales bacterium]
MAYLNAENEYLDSKMNHTRTAGRTLQRDAGRIRQDDATVPSLENGYFYYTKYLEGKEYPLYYRKKNLPDAQEELLLDVNILAEGKSYCGVTSPMVSHDNRLMAYGTDYVSRRRYDIHFVNLETGEQLEDLLVNTTGRVVWAADNSTLFYTGKDEETLRADRIVRHSLGTGQESDKVVFRGG